VVHAEARQVKNPSMPYREGAPVLIQGVVQKWLHRLASPCDVEVNGIYLRLPAGAILSLTSFGARGFGGSLHGDVYFIGLDGETYRANSGMSLRIPA